MKNILFAILAVFTLNVNAAVIYNEITNPGLDSVFLDAGQSSVDTTTGLEWLSFKNDNTAYTLGYSINEMAGFYDTQGWVLASETQVSSLFNTFFGDYGFAAGANGTQSITPEDTSNLLLQSRNSWILSFGSDASIAPDGVVTLQNNSLYSTGMYVKDDGSIGVAGAKIGVNGLDVTTTLYGTGFGISGFTADTKYSNLGVFMVRSDRGLQPPAVPVPAAAWLFMSGLIGLAAIARRKV